MSERRFKLIPSAGEYIRGQVTAKRAEASVSRADMRDLHTFLSQLPQTERPVTSEFLQIITLDAILEEVSGYSGVTIDELKSPARGTMYLARVRQEAMYLMRQMTPHTLGEIGSFLNRRSVSTISNGVGTIKSALLEEESTQRDISLIKERIERRLSRPNS